MGNSGIGISKKLSKGLTRLARTCDNEAMSTTTENKKKTKTTAPKKGTPNTPAAPAPKKQKPKKGGKNSSLAPVETKAVSVTPADAMTVERASELPVLSRQVSTKLSRNGAGVPMIDPMAIYGFRDAVLHAIVEGKSFHMPSHPEFPNPRTEFNKNSRQIVEEIIHNKSIQTPITVYPMADDDGVATGEYALVDGFTRLTAVGEYMVANPSDTHVFVGLPCIPMLEPPSEVKAMMLAYNVNREGLSDLQQGRFLKAIKEERGLDNNQLAIMIGKNPDRGGSRWVNRLIEIASDDALSAGAKSGLGTATLTAVAKSAKTPTDRKAAVDKLVADKASGKPEKEAAKDLGVAKGNRTTLGIGKVMDMLYTVYPHAKASLKADPQTKLENTMRMLVESGGSGELSDVFHDELDALLDGHAALVEFNTLCEVAQINGDTTYERMVEVERTFPEDRKTDIYKELEGWMPDHATSVDDI